MNRSLSFPELGTGVGLRPAHYAVFRARPPRTVNWVEVVTENFLPLQGAPNGRALRELETVRRDYPVALHGVGLSLASADPLCPEYVREWKRLIQRIDPFLVSDHLCWSSVDGVHLHDLLPFPLNERTLAHVVDKIRRAQDAIGRRILVENLSSYVEFPESTLTEWGFLGEVARRADCGILLDVNNVYVSALNHGFSASEYLAHLPLERVGQIHLAGHVVENGVRIDTHDQPVCEEVWSLFESILSRLSLLGRENVNAMIERDGRIPAWDELERELSRISSIRSAVSSSRTNQKGEWDGRSPQPAAAL